jgi:hypothetical protein
MRVLTNIAEGLVELISIGVFLFVTVGWLAGAAGHLPL